MTIQNGKGNLSKQWNRLVKARDIALEEAKKSPCVRRKYGAIFFSEDAYVVAHNKRVSRCCDGNICIRDLMKTQHGHNTDIGAEIHAEQSLIIEAIMHLETYSMMIVGYDKDGEMMYGSDCWPCYSCARMIKVAGMTQIWVPEKNDEFSNHVVDGIMEHYETEVLGLV